MTIRPEVWTIITGLLLPFVVGTVTHIAASPRMKAAIGALCAVLTAVATRATLGDGSAFLSAALIRDVVITFALSAGGYEVFWKHFNINDGLAPDHGIG